MEPGNVKGTFKMFELLSQTTLRHFNKKDCLPGFVCTSFADLHGQFGQFPLQDGFLLLWEVFLLL